MNMKNVTATKTDEELRQSFLAIFGKQDMAPDRMLAILSHMVGQLIAMQDQRKMTPDQALEIVTANIEQGNRDAVALLQVPQGSA